MKHITFVVTVVLVFLVTGLPAHADKTYSEKDLKGTYYFNMVQIRQDETIEVDYCDSYGTMTFDGAGGATSSGTRKCSVTGSVTDSNDFTYTVSTTGVVLITEVGFTDPTRAQIVDKGRMLLVDGTTRDPLIYVSHGLGVKQ